MGRKLYTYADISAESGVSVSVLRVWLQREKLPAPDYRLGQSPVWEPETIEPWLSGFSPARSE